MVTGLVTGLIVASTASRRSFCLLQEKRKGAFHTLADFVKKVREGRPHVVDVMISGGVDMVFNTTEGATAIADSFTLRQTALYYRIPYYTTVAGCRAVVAAISALKAGSLDVAPLQSYFKSSI